MSGFEPIDLLALAILGLAALRGLFLGLIREAFSIAGLAAAAIAVRVWSPAFAPTLARWSDGRLGEGSAPWVSGALLAIAAIALVAGLSALARRGVRAAGLGWADRAGGAVIGAAEGALVAGVLVLMLAALLGPGHSLLASSRALEAVERAQAAYGEAPLRDVAAPPEGR